MPDIKKRVQNVVNIYNNAENITKGLDKYRKLVAECSTGNSYSINDIIDDMKSIIAGGAQFSEFIKDPNRITCFAESIVGLTLFTKDNADKVGLEIKGFYKGLIPYLSEIYKEMVREFSFSNIDFSFENRLKELSSNLMDIGIGFAQAGIETVSEKLEDKVYQAGAILGKHLAFLMVVSSEFRYALYLTFLKNIQEQTQNRIQKLIDLRRSIINLVYEIDTANNTGRDSNFHQVLLDNYKSALNILEGSVFLTDHIEKNLLATQYFDTRATDNLISYLDSAQKLLIGQRNQFLESILQKPEIEFNSDIINDVFVLANDYSRLTAAEIHSNKSEEAKDSIKWLENQKEITNIYITKKETKPIIVSIDVPEKEDRSTGIWIKTTTDNNITTDSILQITDNFFQVLRLDNIEIKDPITNIVNVFKALFIKNIHESWYTSIDKPSLNGKEIIHWFDIGKNSYTIEKRKKEFTISDDGYTISDNESIDAFNTILLNKAGDNLLKTEWGNEKNWKMIIFSQFNDITNSNSKIETEPQTIYRYLILPGSYPNFVEKKEAQLQEALNQLPEPFKSLYDQYKYLKATNISQLNLNDWFNVGGTISNFVFGKDIIAENLDKYGIQKFSYDTYLESSQNVIKTFCPLKNTMLNFYSLLDTLSNYDTTQEEMNKNVTQNWVLFLNRTIKTTLESMTGKDVLGNYQTITDISNSPFYYKLLPSIAFDYDNLVNLKALATTEKEIGKGFNINSELNEKFKKIKELVDWLNAGNKDLLLNAESEMWAVMSNSLISSISLMLEGERVSAIKPALDVIEKRISKLVFKLSELNGRLLQFQDDNFKSQDKFTDLLNSVGLEHWTTYIKEGKFDLFIKEDATQWVGKYGQCVHCLENILKHFTKYDRKLIQKVANYLKYLDFNELATLVQIGQIDLNLSLNLNLFSGTPSSTKANIQNFINNINVTSIVMKSISEKMNKIKK